MSDGSSRPRRPGPDLLYEAPPTPPQLESTTEWPAAPLARSGRTGYDDGEFLYQDFVYDDHGASTGDPPVGFGRDPQQQPRGAAAGPPTGDLVYPNDVGRYGHNAADLLEFRAQRADEGVAYRVTLQTMREPDAAAVVIGIDVGDDAGDDAGGNAGDDAGGERNAGGDAIGDDWGFGIGELGPSRSTTFSAPGEPERSWWTDRRVSAGRYPVPSTSRRTASR